MSTINNGHIQRKCVNSMRLQEGTATLRDSNRRWRQSTVSRQSRERHSPAVFKSGRRVLGLFIEREKRKCQANSIEYILHVSN